jgi:hypothetical protein
MVSKSLRLRVSGIMFALRNEMRKRTKKSNPLNQIFGQKGNQLMEMVCARLLGMPDTKNEDEHVSRIIKDNFVEFLGLYEKHAKESRVLTIREQIDSLEVLRSNIAAMNVIAAAGQFHDPDYEIAALTSRVASLLEQDIKILKQL